MIKLNVFVTAAAALACVAIAMSASAQEYGNRPLRYGNTSGWTYDGRDDDRDFPTNGYFPGNFAADPANATIGAAGIFGTCRSPRYAIGSNIEARQMHRRGRCCWQSNATRK